MDNKIVKLIFEKKMSDAKDLIDQTLSSKLAGIISEGLDTTVNEKLDPVGKEDKDVDNDGDTDDTDSYLLNRRKAIGKAIAKKGGKTVEPMKEEEEKEDTKKLDSRGLGVTRQSGIGDAVKAYRKERSKKKPQKISSTLLKKVDEGAPEAPHDSSFVHGETEAREKKLKKTMVRAKPSRGGSY
tara:strand:- start:4986 stop:5534 length:549 start_codon:yes stop_codon:yes gene_type:complete